MFYDSEMGEEFVLLYYLFDCDIFFVVYNSLLFEGLVFGFEYGYNVYLLEMFVMWEV